MASVCFNCRIQTSAGECQNCKGATHNMGRNFKVPKRRNIREWRKARLLYERGYFGFQKSWSGGRPSRYVGHTPKRGRYHHTGFKAIDTLTQAKQVCRVPTEEETYRRALSRRFY